MNELIYLGIETQLPDLGRWGFESSNGVVSVNVEDPNEAVEGGRGGDHAGRVSCHRRHAKAVAGVGALKDEVVRFP